MIYIKLVLMVSLWATLIASNLIEATNQKMSQQSEQSRAKRAYTAVDRAVERVMNKRFDASNKEMKRALGEIEVELTKEIDLNEVEPNLERIVEMLEETEETSGILANRLDGLQLLGSLDKVWRGTARCNHESYTILAKNNEALDGFVQVPRSKFTTRPHRMQAVLRTIALKHAEDCKDKYPQRYKELVQEMPADLYHLIKTFLDLLVDVHIKDNSKPAGWSLFGNSAPKLEPADAVNAPKIMSSFKSIDGAHEAALTYDFLKNYVKDDPDQWYLTKVPRSETDNRLVLKQGKIQQLLRRHLTEPCARYMKHLGPEVFEPFEFDNLILEKDESHLNPELAEFQKARIRYYLCKRLVKKDERALLKGVIAIASKAPVHEFNSS